MRISDARTALDVQQAALLDLLEALAERGYAFVTPTPSTCRRMAGRPSPERPDLRDVFGWSRPFAADQLDPELMAILERAEAVEPAGERLRCRVRVSSVHGRLFLHSAHAARDGDPVFLGPDTYRFADLIAREIGERPVRSLLDIGSGAGVGGIVAGLLCPGAEVWLGDVNPAALRLAKVNAAHAGLQPHIVESAGLSRAPEALDLVVANPPYVAGKSGRTYKDGGDLHGGRLSLDWAIEAMDRLSPGGRMILYTGSAILLGGRDQLREHLAGAVSAAGCRLRYAEIDPDVFASELGREAYDDVERLAAVGAVITRPA